MKQMYGFWEKDDCLSKKLLGNKGFNLQMMYKNGITIPDGFIVPTTICNEYYSLGKKLSDKCKTKLKDKCRELERVTGKRFGDIDNPLFVSIRSGAEVSMPGMLDTILNVGITKDMVFRTKETYLLRGYITFLNEYFKGVYGIDSKEKDDDALKKTEYQYKEIIQRKMDKFLDVTGKEFDDSIDDIIEKAICLVFDSWEKPQAKLYRSNKNIREDMYTAVVVQEMKFGNINEKSGSGVLFTKNPITGEDELYGEYIQNGQGVEVVNGIAKTEPVEHMEQNLHMVYRKLIHEVEKIKKIYVNPQDVEFTFENEEVYILQTRDARVFVNEEGE